MHAAGFDNRSKPGIGGALPAVNGFSRNGVEFGVGKEVGFSTEEENASPAAGKRAEASCGRFEVLDDAVEPLRHRVGDAVGEVVEQPREAGCKTAGQPDELRKFRSGCFTPAIAAGCTAATARRLPEADTRGGTRSGGARKKSPGSPGATRWAPAGRKFGQCV